VKSDAALERPAPTGWISLAGLAGGAAQGPLIDDAGQVMDPLLAVDLDVPADSVLLDRARRAAQASERILIGVRACEPLDEPWHGLLATLSVTLTAEGLGALPRSCVALSDPAAQARLLQSAAAASPQAALVLAQVLRASDQLDVRSALDGESFAYSTLLAGAEFRRWLDGRPARPAPSPAPGPPVLVERDAGVLRITLNRPARRNAYSRELRDALADALVVAAVDDSISRVTIAGSGPSFCAGGDLDEFGTTPDPATAHFVRTYAGAAALLHRVADRTEAWVHGACVGAGTELTAFAGRVIARPGTTFQLPEIGMGLIPGAGGTVGIPRRIGRWRTLHLALSGSRLDVATAARWGLVDEVIDAPTPRSGA
jgi:enoyl-CoA hydratase/carnithine racemase